MPHHTYVMDLREKLIKLRDEHGLSQAEMAERLDVTRQTVSRWEAGKSTPSVTQLAGICKTFKLDANEMLEIGVQPAPAAESLPTEGKAERPRHGKKFILSVALLAVLFAAAIAGLAVTIAYAVKDAQYDTSSTVWIITIPQNTPMIVLSVILGMFILLIAALFAYVITKEKRK